MQRPVLEALTESHLNPSAWFKKYELFVELYIYPSTEKNEVDEVLDGLRAKYLPFYLGGRVLATYDQLGEQEKANYKVVRGKLLAAYRMNGATAYQRFTSLMFTKGSVDMHVAELKGLLELIPGMSAMATKDRDGLVLEQLLRGLPPSLARELRLICVDPATGEVALERVLERARLLPELVNGDVSETNTKLALVGATPRKEPETGWRSREAGGRGRDGGRCRGCGRAGHFQRDCTDECFTCGEKGHHSKDCPKRPNRVGGSQRQGGGDLLQGPSQQSKLH
jgi:hypothetical protein